MSANRPTRRRRSRKRLIVGPANLQPGERRIYEVDGKSIGVFNVAGHYYALHNRCPHMAGNLCEGPVTGTALPTERHEYHYGREGEIIRCGWHGWEFDIASGQALVDPRVRARTYAVTIEEAQIVLHI